MSSIDDIPFHLKNMFLFTKNMMKSNHLYYVRPLVNTMGKRDLLHLSILNHQRDQQMRTFVKKQTTIEFKILIALASTVLQQ